MLGPWRELRALVMGPSLQIRGGGELEMTPGGFIPDKPPKLSVAQQAGAFRHGFARAGVLEHR